jgi:hypothetical protein
MPPPQRNLSGTSSKIGSLSLIKCGNGCWSFHARIFGVGWPRRKRSTGWVSQGLLALMYPGTFGTVDQFAVEALKQVRGLPEESAIARMDPKYLSIKA